MRHAPRMAKPTKLKPQKLVRSRAPRKPTVTSSTRVAVITPVHGPSLPYLRAAYASLLLQTRTDWYWWIALTAPGLELPKEISDDVRVHVLPYTTENFPVAGRIGLYKSVLSHAATATSAYVLELDADDELHRDAVSEVSAAFDAGADFVYSDCAYWKDLGGGEYAARWPAYPFGTAYGWQAPYKVSYRGMELLAQHAPPVTSQNIRRVEWSPDHLRAWRLSKYLKVGGHKTAMAVADDHDLIVRMYLDRAVFKHIPKPLYFYRVHGENTVSTRNAEIQLATQGVYERNILALAESFARDNGLDLIDLCGAHTSPAGYTVLDAVKPDAPREYRLCDLNAPWPVAANSVGVLRAVDAIEHLKDPIHTMNEAYRVLAPGGMMLVSTPSTNGPGAFCDPTHVSFWNQYSFRYYADPQYMRYIPAFTGKFQLLRAIEYQQPHMPPGMPYVDAQLVKLGPGYEPMGSMFP